VTVHVPADGDLLARAAQRSGRIESRVLPDLDLTIEALFRDV
jgi:hypothetical protein